MNRRSPCVSLEKYPCSIVAVQTACNNTVNAKDIRDYMRLLSDNGYATLDIANKFIRNHLSIKRRIDYKRGHRPKLRDLHIDGAAIVCVLGHFIYLDHNDYYSFFYNEDDDVVTVWVIKD